MIERFLQTITPLFDFDAIQTVFDVGSRDAQQSEELHAAFPDARVVAFECNPETLPLCYAAAERTPNITIVPKAVNNVTGTCAFFPLNHARSLTAAWPNGNPGASSLFRAVAPYFGDVYMQDEITVPCTRLDDYCAEAGIGRVDLLWMDLQGAELLALQSLGPLLESIKAIHTEVAFSRTYDGQVLFPELDAFLRTHGFVPSEPVNADPAGEHADVIYLNTRYVLDVLVPVGPRDLAVAGEAVTSMLANVVGLRTLYLIAADDPGDARCTWMPEAMFPFALEDVCTILGPAHAERAGWYYQQLLKLYAPLVIPNLLPRYLVTDADIHMLTRMAFVDQTSGAPMLVVGKNALHPGYADHLDALNIRAVAPQMSCTSHTMLYESALVCELLAFLGEHAWRSYLNAVPEAHRNYSGASEQEVYANFVLDRYPSRYTLMSVPFDDAPSVTEAHRQQGCAYVACHWYMRERGY